MTLHLEDIQFALERNYVAQIEDGFRALVGWPHEDEIVGANADSRRGLIETVCDALRNDDRQMPGHIVTLIEDGGADLHGASYRNGACAVLADIDYWRSRLGSTE